MKAARLYENESVLHVEETSQPTIDRGEALIDVLATGLCRSDLKIINGFLKPPSYPHVLGHEIAGRLVDAKPSNSREEVILTGIRKGQTVLVHFYVTCGRCRYCLAGRSNLCSSRHRLGFDLPGGFAEYVKAPISNLVPTSLGEEAAVLTDAGATILHALRKTPPQAGELVIVMGVGGLGAFAVQLAALMGGEVVALDVREESLSLAEHLGAKTMLNIRGLDEKAVRENLISATSGRLSGVFLDLVGNKQSQSVAMATLAPGGRLMQIGYSQVAYENVTPKDIVYKEIQIIGSLASTLSDLRDIVELTESGRVKLEVTTKYHLDRINEATQQLEQNRISGRAVIIP